MPLYRDKISQKATLLDSWQKDNKGYYAFFDGYFEKEKIRLEKKKNLLKILKEEGWKNWGFCQTRLLQDFSMKKID